MTDNAKNARSLVVAVTRRLAEPKSPCAQGCDRALENAVITAPEARDPVLMQKLDAVAGRVLGVPFRSQDGVTP